MTGTSVLFRADAYGEIGLGHVKRCLAMAQALRVEGTDCAFLCFDDPAARDALEPHDFPVEWLTGKVNEGGDRTETLTTASRLAKPGAVIVVDSYNADERYLGTLKDAGLRTIYCEDFCRTDWQIDGIVNGLVGAEDLPYLAPLKLLGPSHLPLARDYWSPPASRDPNRPAHNILITMGGIDHYNLSVRLLHILDQIDGSIRPHVVIGPYFENIDEIEVAASECRHEVVLHRKPLTLAPVMANCDMAISAGGFSLYELAVMGVATLGVWLWENQRRNVEELGRRGAIAPLAFSDDADWDTRLYGGVRNLIEDGGGRARMVRVAQSLVDGQGALRIARALTTLATEEKQSSRKVVAGMRN